MAADVKRTNAKNAENTTASADRPLRADTTGDGKPLDLLIGSTTHTAKALNIEDFACRPLKSTTFNPIEGILRSSGT